MPRSCIGKVFAVVLATPQTAQKIAYMRGSDSDDIEPQNAITHQITPIRHAQYTQFNSCHRRHNAKEAYSALRDSAKMSGNSYELMKSMKSPTILECGSFRLMRYILWKSAGASVIGMHTTSSKALTRMEYTITATLFEWEETNDESESSSSKPRTTLNSFILEPNRSSMLGETEDFAL